MRRSWLLIPLLACLPALAQIPTLPPVVRNIYTNVPNDVTGGVLTATPSAAMVRPASIFTVQMTLVGGTSATGQVEGSNDKVNWFTLQTSTFSLTTGQTAGLVFNAPWNYIRFNCLTNVGGGTVVVLVAW
jgi:hypothetical protein